MSGRWSLVTAALTGVLALAMMTGCVPKVEYDKAVAAAGRANDELQKSLLEVQSLRAAKKRVEEDLAARDAALAVKDDLIAKLNTGNTDLDKALQDLMEKYRKALDMKGPRPMGPLKILLPPKVDTALRELAGANDGLMDYLPAYGMVKLKSDPTFDKGSSVVKPDADAALKKLAEILSRPEASTFHIYAAGHTDDIPLRRGDTIDKHGSNWGLSLHRAGAVVKVLALAGVAQERLGAAGFSKYHPVAANAPGNKGNPLNRRVEIWVVPPARFLTTDAPGQ